MPKASATTAKTPQKKWRQEWETLTWLSFRLVTSRSKALFEGPSVVSFIALSLGVACLVVSMAVMSGFTSTLQKSVADVTGHLRIRKAGLTNEEWNEVTSQIKKENPEVLAGIPYGFAEGVVAHHGKLGGVIMQGVDPAQVDRVLNLKSRLGEGQFDLLEGGLGPDKVMHWPGILIGKGLAENLQIRVGEEMQVVFPLPSEIDPNQFARRIAKFRVSGILDLGKKEYDDRMLITSIKGLQIAIDRISFSGLILKVKDINRARDLGFKIGRQLGPSYQVSDWHEINENLFEAVEIERVVVFFVIFIIVLASAINVSAALYANVLKRYPEIGILKALGLSKRKVIQIFSLQGVMLGAAGFALGLLVGLLFCVVFSWAEKRFGLIPTSVYKLDHIDLAVRAVDVLWIAISTLTVCFVATLAPAIRGSRLTPVEGIRHE